MKRLKVFAALLLAGLAAHAQLSGVGSLGCSGTVSSAAAVNSSTSTGVFATIATNTPAPFFAVQLDQTSTITGGAVTFQITYDGTNWISVPAGQLFNGAGAAIANPYSFVASTNQSFLVVMGGANGLRLNLTSALTGTGAVTAYYYAVCTIGIAPNGIYSSSLPTLSAGQAAVQQFDAKGQALDDLNYVNGAAINTGHGTASGSIRIELPTDGTGVVGLNAGTNVIGAINGAPSTSASFATAPFRNTAVTSATTVKSSAGNFYGYYVLNNNSSECDLDFFNTTSPTLGTTTPVFTIYLPATTAANVSPAPIAWFNFSTALSVAAVTSSGGSTTCSTGLKVSLAYN